MSIQYAAAVGGAYLGSLGSPKPPGTLSINTNNQGFPYPPRPGGTVYG